MSHRNIKRAMKKIKHKTTNTFADCGTKERI
jgi:hypothetical protein